MENNNLYEQYQEDLPSELWCLLTPWEREEYLRLMNSFRHGPKITSKDRRLITFTNELNLLHDYLESSPNNLEQRCLMVGLCFVGPIVCVNTRQLKAFLNRCKSSINGSFQQLGYVAMKSKAIARECVLSALPMLNSHQFILKQWTARYASDNALFCMISSFMHKSMPVVLPEHLFIEKPKSKHGSYPSELVPNLIRQRQKKIIHLIPPDPIVPSLAVMPQNSPEELSNNDNFFEVGEMGLIDEEFDYFDTFGLNETVPISTENEPFGSFIFEF